MKINNTSKDIIDYFKKFGFVHSEKEQPLMTYNQLLNEDTQEIFIFLYLFDKLTFQNSNSSTIVIEKKIIDIEYLPKENNILFKIDKNVLFNFNIKAIEDK